MSRPACSNCRALAFTEDAFARYCATCDERRDELIASLTRENEELRRRHDEAPQRECKLVLENDNLRTLVRMFAVDLERRRVGATVAELKTTATEMLECLKAIVGPTPPS